MTPAPKFYVPPHLKAYVTLAESLALVIGDDVPPAVVELLQRKVQKLVDIAINQAQRIEQLEQTR
jgi:hypothetical protein